MSIMWVAVTFLFSGAAFFYSSEVKRENVRLKERIKKIEEQIFK